MLPLTCAAACGTPTMTAIAIARTNTEKRFIREVCDYVGARSRNGGIAGDERMSLTSSARPRRILAYTLSTSGIVHVSPLPEGDGRSVAREFLDHSGVTMPNKSRNRKNQPPTGQGKRQSSHLGQPRKLSKRSDVLQAQRGHPELNL